MCICESEWVSVFFIFRLFSLPINFRLSYVSSYCELLLFFMNKFWIEFYAHVIIVIPTFFWLSDSFYSESFFVGSIWISFSANFQWLVIEVSLQHSTHFPQFSFFPLKIGHRNLLEQIDPLVLCISMFRFEIKMHSNLLALLIGKCVITSFCICRPTPKWQFCEHLQKVTISADCVRQAASIPANRHLNEKMAQNCHWNRGEPEYIVAE